jgi:Flp pilus assembly protein TadG
MTGFGFGLRPRSGRASRGQAIVEFALAFPIFFMLLIGLIEGGRFVFYSETLNHAAREGARYAIIHGDNSDLPTGPPTDASAEAVKQAVRDAAVGISDSGTIVIPNPCYGSRDALPACSLRNDRGVPVTVTIEYTYSPVVSIFGPITIEAEATLVINN